MYFKNKKVSKIFKLYAQISLWYQKQPEKTVFSDKFKIY